MHHSLLPVPALLLLLLPLLLLVLLLELPLLLELLLLELSELRRRPADRAAAATTVPLLLLLLLVQPRSCADIASWQLYELTIDTLLGNLSRLSGLLILLLLHVHVLFTHGCASRAGAATERWHCMLRPPGWRK